MTHKWVKSTLKGIIQKIPCISLSFIIRVGIQILPSKCTWNLSDQWKVMVAFDPVHQKWLLKSNLTPNIKIVWCQILTSWPNDIIFLGCRSLSMKPNATMWCRLEMSYEWNVSCNAFAFWRTVVSENWYFAKKVHVMGRYFHLYVSLSISPSSPPLQMPKTWPLLKFDVVTNEYDC